MFHDINKITHTPHPIALRTRSFFFQILNNKILISTLFDNGLSILAYLFYLKRHVMIKKT